MAGIGFTLRALARRDDLLGTVQGFGASALIAAGPWLFTIFALAGIGVYGQQLAGLEEIGLFRLIVIYNFCFSLTFSGPIVIVATRWLADAIFAKQVEDAPGMLVGGMVLSLGLQAPLAAGFYLWLADMAPALKAAAVVNYLLICAIWLISVFLTALKDYVTVTAAFAAGMLVAFLAAVALAPDFGATGALLGFSLGLSLILFGLIARVQAEYPYPPRRLFAFIPYFRRYWELALGAFAYGLAIWVDKWLMWFAPERELRAGVLAYHPTYDSAMFLAYLTIVPSMAMFVMTIETGFYERYQRFFGDMLQHATLSRIRLNHVALSRGLEAGLRNVMMLQSCLSLIAILAAPRAFDLLGIDYLQLGIFRFGVLGALFHTMLMFCCIVLSYFDLRRDVLALQILYLLVNAAASWIAQNAGFEYYGYGYFAASLICALAAFAVMIARVRRLPYIAFVTNNPSVH
ncbi:MAG TPA: exopolysaccharide Pel transporter PelG [Alphaproteobacteria bacterium]|nr:exopolysaccharide Pel transporter PelG [Alphaproteobacteria bacterium]